MMERRLFFSLLIITISLCSLSGCSDDEPAPTSLLPVDPVAPIVGNWNITNIIFVDEGIGYIRYDTIESSGSLSLKSDGSGYLVNEKYVYSKTGYDTLWFEWTFIGAKLTMEYFDGGVIPCTVFYQRNEKMKFSIPSIGHEYRKLSWVVVLEKRRR